MFWFASVFSSFGSMIQTVGASWLMTTLAPSADRIALVQTASALPFFCLSLIAGALADTYDRRVIMLVSQSVMVVGALALGVLTVLGLMSPWLLLAFTFLIGCGGAALGPAWQASIGDQVPRTMIPAAVSLNALGFNIARSVGPALGGLLVAATGAAIAFFINAVSYLGLIVAAIVWKPVRPRSALPPEPLASAIASGLRYVRLSPPLLAILVRCFAFTVPAAAVQALMPVVARDLLGGGAPMFGLLLGGFGVGAMLGAVFSVSIRARLSSDRLLRWLSALLCLALIVLALSRSPALSILAHVVAGGTWMLGLTTFNIGTQMSSPRWVVGRTVATYQTITFGGVALGSWLWGIVAHGLGLPTALGAAAAAALISILLSRSFRVSKPVSEGLDPFAAEPVPEPKVDLDDASGPIVLTIEYRVALSDATEFSQVIIELGRIRRRDGAREWSICQDIDDPEKWVERFESPTWLDHLRRHTRPTVADQKTRDRVAALVASGRGTVRRYIERPPGSVPLGVNDPTATIVGGSPGQL